MDDAYSVQTSAADTSEAAINPATARTATTALNLEDHVAIMSSQKLIRNCTKITSLVYGILRGWLMRGVFSVVTERLHPLWMNGRGGWCLRPRRWRLGVVVKPRLHGPRG